MIILLLFHKTGQQNDVHSPSFVRRGSLTSQTENVAFDALDPPGAMVSPGRVWLSNLVCPPGANNISQCATEDWGSNNCAHTSDVHLECSGMLFNMHVSICNANKFPFFRHLSKIIHEKT